LRAPYAEFPVGTEVAVKRPHAGAGAEALEALELEGRAAFAARHPNLVRAVYAGEDRDGPLVVTLYVPGPSLRELIEEGPQPEPRVRHLGRELAGALAVLHASGWLHGDVKPENARLDAAGRAVLLDLGFARRVDAPGGDERRPGSFPYLAIEQAAGRGASPAADVFALALVLFELALGEHPLAESLAGDPDLWSSALARVTTLLPSSLEPRLSPFFDAVIQLALRADPGRRPSAAELTQHLEQGEAGAWWREHGAREGDLRRTSIVWTESGQLPLVGREQELIRMRQTFERACRAEGGGAVLWLDGEAGSGKSRLVGEFVREARRGAAPPTFLDGRCPESLQERPGAPLLHLLRRWLGLARRAHPGPRERGLLEELVPPRTAEVLFSSLATLSERAPAGEADALATWLASLGMEAPLVVFLDDLSFADTLTLEGLARLAERLPETRLLLILGVRRGRQAHNPSDLENLRARLTARVSVETVVLGPLEEEEVAELVETLFCSSAPRLRLARALHQRSGGSPGALAEILHTMRSRAQVRPSPEGDGELELLITPAELPRPRSVSKMIADRYRELPAERRLWLQRLAVIGGSLEARFLSRAFPPTDPAEAEAVLAGFVADGWLVSAGSRYRFAGPAQRSAVYRALPPERRRRAHAAAARALAAWGGPGRGYQRAFHLHAAQEYEELLEVALPLIERLGRRAHPGRIATLAEWALEGVDHLPESPERARRRFELLETAADAADRLGRGADQRAHLNRLVELELDPTREPDKAGRVYLLHGRFAAATGRYGLARGMLRNAILLFQEVHDHVSEGDACLRLAYVQGHLGDFAEAVHLARRALTLAQGRRQRAQCRLAQGVVALVGDDLELAQRRIDAAMKELRGLQDPSAGLDALAGAHQLRARVYRLAGRPRRAFGSIQHAARLAAQAGERKLEGEIAARHGRLLLDLDRPREAEALLREALLTCRESEYRRGEALAALLLGTLLAEENGGESRELLTRAVRLSHQMGLKRVEALAQAISARVARQSGDRQEALRLSLSALQLLERYGGELADRIVIIATRVILLREAAEDQEARQLEASLRRRVRRVNDRLSGVVMRQRHHRASTSLLEAALSPEGPLYPRVSLAGLEGR